MALQNPTVVAGATASTPPQTKAIPLTADGSAVVVQSAGGGGLASSVDISDTTGLALTADGNGSLQVAPGVPKVLQSADVASTGAVTSRQVTLTCRGKSTLILMIGVGSATANVTVVDTAGNVWINQDTFSKGTAEIQLFFAQGVPAGSVTITVTSDTSASMALRIWEVAGILTAGGAQPDYENRSSDTSSFILGATLTPNAPNGLLILGAVTDGACTVLGNPLIPDFDVQHLASPVGLTNLIGVSEPWGAVSAVSLGASLSASSNWAAISAVFQPVAFPVEGSVRILDQNGLALLSGVRGQLAVGGLTPVSSQTTSAENPLLIAGADYNVPSLKQALRVDGNGYLTVQFPSAQHVVVDSGAGAGTQFADNAASGATPTGTLAMAWDSANSKIRALKVDTSQNLLVAWGSAQHVIIDSATLGTVTVSGTVTANQGGTWNVRTQDGAGTALTSTGSALDVNLKTSSITLNVSAAQSGAWTARPTDGTNPITKTFDLDTGAGTEWQLGTNLRISASGGSIEAKGQQAMASSIPVVLASDQTGIPVSQSGTWSVRTQDGSGTALTSTGSALDVNLKTSSITLNVSVQNASLAVTQSTTPWTIQGDSASGAAKAGNPVQIGGVFNTTQPTVTTGQSVELQSTARGALIVSTGVDTFTVSVSNASIPVTQSGTWNVRMQDGSGTALTSTGSALDVNLKTSSITLNVSVQNATLAVTQSTTPWTIQGDSASGVAKAGNPVQIGGVFNTTQPTVTTGQTVETQATARGALIVATGVDAFSVSISNASLAVTQSTSPWVTADQADVAGGGTVAPTKVMMVGGKTNDGTPQYDIMPLGAGGRTIIVEGFAGGTAVPVSGTVTANQGGAPWSVSQSGNWSVRLQDGAGTAITSTGGALDVNLKTSSITLNVSVQNASLSVTQGTSPWVDNITQIGGAAIALGQTTKSASLPVTLASDTGTLLTQDAADVLNAANARTKTYVRDEEVLWQIQQTNLILQDMLLMLVVLKEPYASSKIHARMLQTSIGRQPNIG